MQGHPQLDVTTSKLIRLSVSEQLFKTLAVLPGFIFGPYAETFPRPITRGSLGTNYLIRDMIHGPVSPIPPYIVDVRDVAKAHVLALGLPPAPGVLERRYLVNAGNLSWREAVDHLKVTHPQLKIPPSSEYPALPAPASVLDTSNTIADLKFGKFIEPKQVIDDAVDVLLELEKSWA